MNPRIPGYFLLLAFLMISIQMHAQSGTDPKKQDPETQLKTLIDSKKFRFTARSATTMKGKTIQLTSEYFLQLDNDSLRVDLPYYGRTYTASYGSTDLALQFNTNQFSYMMEPGKKSGWDINIKPKDQPNAREITLAISSGGYGNLQVTSNSRQPISFYGEISEIKNR